MQLQQSSKLVAYAECRRERVKTGPVIGQFVKGFRDLTMVEGVNWIINKGVMGCREGHYFTV